VRLIPLSIINKRPSLTSARTIDDHLTAYDKLEFRSLIYFEQKASPEESCGGPETGLVYESSSRRVAEKNSSAPIAPPLIIPRNAIGIGRPTDHTR